MSTQPMDIRQKGVRQAQKALRQSQPGRQISEEKFPKVFRSSPSIGNHPCENCENRFDEWRWGSGFKGAPETRGG
jgi:hypothetical protein